jgi:hypothetical protein
VNDQFLYDLRESPSAAFAKQLQKKLDIQPDSRPKRLPWLLSILAIGCAFAFVYQQNSHQTSNPLRQSQNTIAFGPKNLATQLPPTATQLSPAAPVRSPTLVTNQDSTSVAPSPQSRVPAHWRMADLRGIPLSVSNYDFKIDNTTVWDGSASAFLRVSETREHDPQNYLLSDATCIVQGSQAAKFRGKRVRLSAHLKTDDKSSAGMLFYTYDGDGRATGLNTGPAKRINWTQLSLVMDVPDSATRMLYGGCLAKTGSMWVDDVSVEAVGLDVELTGLPKNSLVTRERPNFLPIKRLLSEPTNLNFEEVVPWSTDFIWAVALEPVKSFAEH